MIIVRFADDIVVGFEHESDARRFWDAMRKRLEEFSLSLHPDRTRLIEFGRIYSVSNSYCIICLTQVQGSPNSDRGRRFTLPLPQRSAFFGRSDLSSAPPRFNDAQENAEKEIKPPRARKRDRWDVRDDENSLSSGTRIRVVLVQWVPSPRQSRSNIAFSPSPNPPAKGRLS